MSNEYKLNSPKSLNYITEKMDEVLRKKIIQYKNLFKLDSIEQIQINYFDTIEDFRKFIYELRGENKSLPNYATGTYDKGMINAFIEPNIPIDSIKYYKKVHLASHELFHILYMKYVLKNDYSKRIVWYDEGMAQFLSGEKDYLLNFDRFKEYYLKVKEKTLMIPNLNVLEHGTSFYNENYNGYDLSYLCVRYLNEILDEIEFKKLMFNFDKIKEYGNRIINDMFMYYDNILDNHKKK